MAETGGTGSQALKAGQQFCKKWQESELPDCASYSVYLYAWSRSSTLPDNCLREGALQLWKGFCLANLMLPSIMHTKLDESATLKFCKNLMLSSIMHAKLDAIDCLVRALKVHPSLVVSFFSLQALFSITHYSAYCFLCIYECNMPVIIFFVDHSVWEYAGFALAQGRTP